VAGDVDATVVADRLDRLPLEDRPAPPPLPPLEWHGRQHTQQRHGVDQVHARLAFPAMPAADPEVPVLGVLNRLLGVGASSRLFQRLREQEGLTYDIWSAPMLRRPGGLLEVGWACAPGVFRDVWRLVGEELRRLLKDLDDDEVAVAKQALVRGLTMDCELPAARCAMDVAELLERGRRFDPEVAMASVAGVTTKRVAELAARLLRTDSMAAAVCGPEGLSVQVA
jgi:predicted Zn-dependent peptidase